MKMKFLTLCFLLFVFGTTWISGQNNAGNKYSITGKIVDETTGEPLIGASVSYETGKGVVTDTGGYFNLSLPDGNYVLKINYAGYTSLSQKVSVNGANKIIENIKVASNNNLDEVEIAADVAKMRETPIAFSDVDAKQISQELGANDITMLLNSTPGAYASQQGGGAGDSRVNIRGFDQKNVAVLVDGIPVNDMENGQVYWSNWSGLAEITKKMQVQRGLGASKLALPSVGGVINIITKTPEQEKFFVIRNDMGTANYQRFAAGYNSGLIKNKVGVILGGTYTQGDGYIDQTWQKTWSYYGKVSYKINRKNLLVFGFNGSPQIHAQRSYAINMVFHDRTFARKEGINADSIYALTSSNSMNKYTTANTGARGIQYSPDWGYVNGKPVDAKVNYFHKPLFNLSYFLHINSKLSYSNVLYMSLGQGGGTALSTYPQYDKTGTGQLSMQGLFDANHTTPTGTLVPGQRPSSFYIYSSINNHKWVGTLSTVKYQQSQKLDFLGGLDARYYIGTHYQTPYNMLGGDYVLSNSDLNSDKNPLSSVKYIGDKINYYYQSKITWLGLFGQMEYKTDRISAFITVTGNQTGFQIINYYARKDIVLSKNNIIRNAVGYGDTLYTDGTNYGVQASGTHISHNTDGSIMFKDNLTNQNVTIAQNYTTYNSKSPQARANTSQVKIFTGYTVKGGFNYKLNYNHNVFINLGQMNLTPRFSNIYATSGVSAGNVTNQLIYTAELGYSIKYSQVAINFNGYITKWGNRPSDYAQLSSKVDPVTQAPLYYNVSGVDALLKGFEFDLTYKPAKFIEVKGFGMLADWRWNSGGTSYVFTGGGSKIDSTVFNAKGVHIGNAPQRQLGANAKFEVLKGLYIKLQYTYFDKMYAQFDPTKLTIDNVTKKDYRQMDSWKMPAFGLVDLYMGYTIRKGKTVVELIASMNNVLNVVYMTDATFSTTPDNYNALNSYGWMGLGRRINVAAKITF
jgi:iron complex outermembrane receptor protein